MKLTIEALRGVWRGQIDHRTEFGDTLEELLAKLAPTAPEENIWKAAEVLGGILGAEVVELQELSEGVYDNLEDFFASLDANGGFTEGMLEGLAPLREQDDVTPVEAEPVEESWQPTEAQQAYFAAPEPSLEESVAEALREPAPSLVNELLEERRREALEDDGA